MSQTKSTRTAGNAKTLPRDYYISPDIFQRETEKIFLNHWLYAGRISEIKQPGDFILFEMERESIVILRNEDKAIRAFHNICRHRGTRLCDEPHGHLDRKIRCSYHAWTYDLNGQLVGAPNMQEVKGFRKQEYSLHPVVVGVWQGCIFINLSSNPQPFEEAFVPLQNKFDKWGMADLGIAHRIVYHIEANWKLVFQNYSECYHCPSLHPQLNRLTSFRTASNDLEEGPFLGGPMRLGDGHESMTMTGKLCASPLANISGDDLQSVYYYTIFPNMLLSVHPDYVLIHRIDRIDVDKTRIVCDWLFHPNEIAKPDFDPSDAIEFWNTTNEQDWQVSELSQKGITSRAYQPGPYAELESMIAAWDRHYLAVLDE